MSKSKLLSLLSTLILTAFSQLGFSQSDKAKKIDEYVTPFVKAGHFSGVILASENGKVIYEKAFGLANADYKIPNQLNTRIGIACFPAFDDARPDENGHVQNDAGNIVEDARRAPGSGNFIGRKSSTERVN
jgi:hypothetical protein